MAATLCRDYDFCGCELRNLEDDEGENQRLHIGPGGKSSMQRCGFNNAGIDSWPTCLEGRLCDNDDNTFDWQYKCTFLMPPLAQGGAHWEITHVSFEELPGEPVCWYKIPTPLEIPEADVVVQSFHQHPDDPDYCSFEVDPPEPPDPPMCGLLSP